DGRFLASSPESDPRWLLEQMRAD
ncbi:MAG: hypothetical protein JWP20_2566, partial [Roseomonas sp.]|nr:hypothetical protein [Roseomonas sp.]